MRAFKTCTGETVGQWVSRVRTERAKNLLAKQDLSLPEIANQLGFATVHGFSVAFHRATGEAPSHFRRKAQVSSSQEDPGQPADFSSMP